MKTKKTTFAIALTACIMFMLTAINSQSQIQFEGYHSQGEGGAGWNADGTGPEPAATGHQVPLPGAGIQSYYAASLDYITGDPDNACFHLKEGINGFPAFEAALADNGYLPGQVKIKVGLNSLEEDLEGIDRMLIGDMYYTNYYGQLYVFELDGEPMLEGEIAYSNFSLSSGGNIWTVVNSFTKPVDASGGSSNGAQEVATAFLSDLQGVELKLTYQLSFAAYLNGNGRNGAYYNIINGVMEKGLPTIPYIGLVADHEGGAGWDADGSGPEPLRNGHLSYLYFGASRDYDGIDPDPNAAFGHFLDNAEGFTNFYLQMEYRGYTPDQIKIKIGLCSLDEDIAGEDWFGEDTLNHYQALARIEIDGEPCIGYMIDTINYIFQSNWTWNATTSPAIAYDASENSSSDIQLIADGFFKDLELRQLNIEYEMSFSSNFSDNNGRDGAFYQIDAGNLIAKENICTRVYESDVSGTWMASCSPYIIEGDITIPSGEILTIEPGVWVKFMDRYPINVQGSVVAEGDGTNTGDIVFTAVNPDKGWGGFDIDATAATESISFDNCIFEYGSAFGENGLNSGGAIAVRDFDNLTIDNCLFRNNWAELTGTYPPSGGAIALGNSSIVIHNSVFFKNFASDYGGAILCYSGSSPEISHCLFHNNTAGIDAGAIEIYTTSNPILTNNTFSMNTAGHYGGAIDAFDYSNPDMVNCIFWGNTANEYDQISITSDDCNLNINYCDVEDGKPGIGPNSLGTNGSYENNLDENPVFVELLAWDFNLDLDLSPCIDAGDPSMPDPDGTPPEMGCYYYPQTGIFTNKTDDLQLYPNPASSQIFIANDWKEVSEIRIEVINFLGQKMSGFNALSSDSKKIQIDVSGYPAGSYFCKITSGNKTQTSKFIKY
jgi:parallel beta-helix repeat protein